MQISMNNAIEGKNNCLSSSLTNQEENSDNSDLTQANLGFAESLKQMIKDGKLNASKISVKNKFDKKVIGILRNWLLKNVDHPYPSEAEKDKLCQQTGLNKKQVQNWFTNTRKRYIQPFKERLELDGHGDASKSHTEENEGLQKVKVAEDTDKNSFKESERDIQNKTIQLVQVMPEICKNGFASNSFLQNLTSHRNVISSSPSSLCNSSPIISQRISPFFNSASLVDMSAAFYNKQQALCTAQLPLNLGFSSALNYDFGAQAQVTQNIYLNQTLQLNYPQSYSKTLSPLLSTQGSNMLPPRYVNPGVQTTQETSINDSLRATLQLMREEKIRSLNQIPTRINEIFPRKYSSQDLETCLGPITKKVRIGY